MEELGSVQCSRRKRICKLCFFVFTNESFILTNELSGLALRQAISGIILADSPLQTDLPDFLQAMYVQCVELGEEYRLLSLHSSAGKCSADLRGGKSPMSPKGYTMRQQRQHFCCLVMDLPKNTWCMQTK